MTAAAIVRLDRRISRASEIGKGIRLEQADLDLLIGLGLADLVATAKSKFLKDQSQCRNVQRQSTGAGNTGSIGTDARMEPSDHPTSPYFGTTATRDASEARRRLPPTKTPAAMH